MKKWLMGMGIVLSLGLAVWGEEATVTVNAGLQLERPALLIAPRIFTPEWQRQDSTGVLDAEIKEHSPFKIKIPGQGELSGRATFTRSEDGAITASYLLTAQNDLKLNTLCMNFSVPCATWAGGSWQGAERQGKLPFEHGALGVFHGGTRNFKLINANGQEQLSLSFPEHMDVMVQDDRQWEPNFSIRFGKISSLQMAKGDTQRFDFTVQTGTPLALVYDRPVTMQAGDEWMVLENKTQIAANSALDFARMPWQDAPAGKHGYLVTKNAHFEFEKRPGVPQRFYGVNLCFGANFLERDEAQQLAQRLAGIGYNSVRFHHHDGGLVQGSADGTTINARQMTLFDNLAAACIEYGLYLTTDLFVSRPVPWRAVGVAREGTIAMNEYKVLVLVHEGAFHNFKEFARQFLTHVNPHTGRSYAHEPALNLLALINEGNAGNFLKEMHGIPEWGEAWRAWLAARQAAAPTEYRDIPAELPSNYYVANRHTAAFTLFLHEVESRFVRRVTAFLRDELKCRALLTNRSSWTNRVVDQLQRSELFDFVDDHFYVDHPQFLEQPWRLPSFCDNQNPFKNQRMGVPALVFTRLLDKPFTITEYNYSAPGQFRGVGGVATGALGALQDWDGLWRFTYAHSRDRVTTKVGGPINYFDVAGDPLATASERAAILLFLREDLKPLKRSYALVLPPDEVVKVPDGGMPLLALPWGWLAWYERLGTVVAPDFKQATRGAVYPAAYQVTTEAQRDAVIASGTMPGGGALQIDQNSGRFTIITPRTCGGFIEKGEIKAGALQAMTDTAATIWLSSLEEAPIHSAHRLLLTHLTEIQNSGTKFAERARQRLLAWGGLPHLVRVGSAEIAIKLDTPGAYKVYALDVDGVRMAEVPTRSANQQLHFTAKVNSVAQGATLLYEIIKSE